METRFKPGDRVIVLDGKKVGDPHMVGFGGNMINLIGCVCTIRTAEYLSFVERENYRLVEDERNYNFDGIWLIPASGEENKEIESFFGEFEVTSDG